MSNIKNVGPLTKFFKNLIFLTIPAILVGLLCLEVLSRITWDHKLGTPGFSLPHPVRGWELAKNYSGYWEGIPVKTNNLGFRDNQDYEIEYDIDSAETIIPLDIDLWMAKSTDNGHHWSEAENVTNTPTTGDLVPTTPTTGGDIHLKQP